jgi:hypothetical protein
MCELDLNLETIKNIVDQYEVKFSHINVKARIYYDKNIIKVSPAYNDLEISLMHELVHHQIDNVLCLDNRYSETEMDRIAEGILIDNEVKDYLKDILTESADKGIIA